jgi:hypothetical protein
MGDHGSPNKKLGPDLTSFGTRKKPFSRKFQVLSAHAYGAIILPTRSSLPEVKICSTLY